MATKAHYAGEDRGYGKPGGRTTPLGDQGGKLINTTKPGAGRKMNGAPTKPNQGLTSMNRKGEKDPS